MAKKRVGICDGHGMETPGKRTPIFPAGSGLKSETGNFMHENEFNRAVAKYLDKHLKRCGFETFLMAPTDADTSLKSRVSQANDLKLDLYFSIHANANTSQWGNWGGIETYAGSSDTSKKYAAIVQKHLLGGTKLRDRGVKDGAWLYLNRVNCPLVLIEAGFMDNLEEAKLLLSDAYRQETAKESAQAICEIFGVKYIEETIETKAPAPSNDGTKLVVVTYKGKEGLNIRKYPDFTSEVIAVAYEKDAFTIIRELKDFYQIKSGGFITRSSSYVTTKTK